MRFSFTMGVVVAATLTSAAIIPRTGNLSRLDIGSSHHERSSGQQVESRQGRTHPREFFLAPDNADIPQRRSADVNTYSRRHPRDFTRREPHPLSGDESRPVLKRRHPRGFTHPEAREDDEFEVRNTPGRHHPRQFRSFD
ncbi:hypothetical protein B0H11DRAFT_586331 [Mycena galericulata]|nr:hypothetical protein B0H11DRAFT_586331 [Mycena galericulata]